MNDMEVIYRQTKQIEELKSIVSDLNSRIKKACTLIYCIGGPLNDNKLKYSNEQLKIFQQIVDELDI
jgi:hypothetical protein